MTELRFAILGAGCPHCRSALIAETLRFRAGTQSISSPIRTGSSSPVTGSRSTLFGRQCLEQDKWPSCDRRAGGCRIASGPGCRFRAPAAHPLIWRLPGVLGNEVVFPLACLMIGIVFKNAAALGQDQYAVAREPRNCFHH
jgi:hypothetical protein